MKNSSTLYLTFVFIIINTIILQGQTTPAPDSRPTPIGLDHRVLGMARTTSEFYTHPEGDQYKNTIYKEATLFDTKNKPIGDHLLRYNMYRDEMEGPGTSNRKIIYYKEGLSKVILEDTEYFVFDYTDDDNKLTKGFFIEILADTNCGIYVQDLKKIELGKLGKDGYHKHTNTKFVEIKKYFVKFEDSDLRQVYFKKNKVLKTFPKHQQELKDFIKNNRMKMDNIDDLIKLVSYYNSLYQS